MESAQIRFTRASRPWRSSPLSTLPPIISESTDDLRPSSASILSDTLVSTSPYPSPNASRATFPAHASTSSVSLPAPASSHGHRARSRAASPDPRTDAISPPPRARTISHGHSRSDAPRPGSVSPPPSMPPTYSRSSPRPALSESDVNATSKHPSTSRDPASNWMSSTPFGPAAAPKFSRLTMASPAVVMPLSAREFRKRRAKGSRPAREISTDEDRTTAQPHNGVPAVKVSPPPSEDPHQSRPLSPTPGDFPQPQPPLEPSKPASTKSRRPHTPPRSSPLATHPPISPKSSAATFYSFTSADDDTPPSQGLDDSSIRLAVRRRRRKSVPDRLSNAHRMSLVEAMNRLSQESTTLHRLSVVSQASGHTLFYDLELDENAQPASDAPDDAPNSTPARHTQSLEDLSSTLTRTGIEVVPHDADGNPGSTPGDDRKAKRNVRTVRISDTVQVSPAPLIRRRKLTKSRRGSVRGSVVLESSALAPTPTETIKDAKPERRSLLPWKSKASSEPKAADDVHFPTSPNGIVDLNEDVTATSSSAPAGGPSRAESGSKPDSDAPPSVPRRKSRRYTFSFFSSSPIHRPKHQKAHTAPPTIDLRLDQDTKGKPNESGPSGTDSTSTSIRTITQGSQATLTPASYETPSGAALEPGPAKSLFVVPMLRRVNAQAMAMAVPVEPAPSHQADWDSSGSTPSLLTNGSTGTTASAPRAPALSPTVRLTLPDAIGEPFFPRPSGLKESFTDRSEVDQGVSGEQKSFVQDPSSARGAGAETRQVSEYERTHLRVNVSSSALSVTLGQDQNQSLRSVSRPGTSSSTLTTATTASYVSFSTLPASAATSTTSTSPSTSPLSMGGDKHDSDRHPYGHFAPSPSAPGDMHPMFTVPLVTVPASALSHPCFESGGGRDPSGIAKYMGGRKNERHGSESLMPALSRTWTEHPPNHMHVPAQTPVNVNSRLYAPGVGVTTTAALVPPPPSKAKKMRRPQTAPAGVGANDVAFRFFEDAKVLGPQGSGARLAKHKPGESRFKMVLKGLLRRTG